MLRAALPPESDDEDSEPAAPMDAETEAAMLCARFWDAPRPLCGLSAIVRAGGFDTLYDGQRAALPAVARKYVQVAGASPLWVSLAASLDDSPIVSPSLNVDALAHALMLAEAMHACSDAVVGVRANRRGGMMASLPDGSDVSSLIDRLSADVCAFRVTHAQESLLQRSERSWLLRVGTDRALWLVPAALTDEMQYRWGSRTSLAWMLDEPRIFPSYGPLRAVPEAWFSALFEAMRAAKRARG